MNSKQGPNRMKTPYLYALPSYQDIRGSLTVAEGGLDLPFQIQRVFWITGADSESERGGHGHRECEQVLVAVSGSVRVGLKADGFKGQLKLDDPGKALYVPPGTILALYGFTPQTALLVLCSHRYDAEDYV